MLRSPCCLHGWRDCPICSKHEGECDFGSCTAPATTTTADRVGGRLIERRPACDRHAHLLKTIGVQP